MVDTRSRKKKPRSIRTQITALLWIAVLPLAALLVRSSYEAYQLTLANSEALTLGLAQEVGASAEQLLSMAETQMLNASRLHSEQLLDPEFCPDLSASLLGIFGYLDALGAHNHEGKPVCWTLPVQLSDTMRFDDMDWFQELLGGKGFAVGAPQWGPYSGQWVVVLAVPLRAPDGGMLGVMSGTLPVSQFQDLLTSVELDPEELVTITTVDRVVVARSADPADYVGQTLDDNPEAGAAFESGRAMSGSADSDGVPRTWGRIDLTRADWLVYAGIPTARIRGPALVAAARGAGLIALIVILAGFLTASIHRRIVGSLADLVKGVRAAAEGRAIPLPEGAPLEVAAVADQLSRTLAERERAEAAERAAKTRYRSILDNVVFGISLTTLDGRFLDVNPALVAMLGYEGPGELIAAGPSALYPNASEREHSLAEWEAHGEIHDVERVWLRKDGRPITVRLNGRVLNTEDGPVFEVIVEDITFSKAFDEERRQTQKMEAIGRLAGGIAHDFNNLLTVIAGNSEILLIELPDSDPSRAEISEIAEAASRAEALTGQLLAFGRKEKTEASALHPNEVVTNLQSMLGRLLNESIHFETDLANDLPSVSAERGKLEQVIVNLVVNARDALPTGGRIGLATSRASRAPGADAGSGEDWVCIGVEDDGVGMDDETRGLVFEPFFTTKGRGEGSGLGLATTYGIVTQMGGHVTVSSEVGVGTRFEVWLPAADEGAAEDANGTESALTASDASQDARGTETILVVEDEPQVRRIVERILTGAGYEVSLARDGHEAMTLAGDSEAVMDLVITDVVMPRVQGGDLAEHLRATRPGTPILFISGHTFDLPIEKLVGNDSDSFLPKPFTPDELTSRVRLLLDRSAVQSGH